MSRLDQALAAAIPDPALRALVGYGLGAVRFSLDRTAAHAANPATAALPAEADALERALSARLARVPPEARSALSDKAARHLNASAAERTARYAAAASFDAKDTRSIARQARDRGALGQHTAPLALADDVLERLTHRHAGLRPTDGKLDLLLHSVRCLHETGELGADEIDLAIVATDVLGRMETRVPTRDCGKFRRKDDKANFQPPANIHTYSLSESAIETPYSATLFLSERDRGGLDAVIDAHQQVSNREMVELATLAAFVAIGAAVGAVEGALAGASFGVGIGLGIVGAAATGLIVGVVGVVAGAVAMGVTILLAELAVDLVSGWRKDDVFPAILIAQTLSPTQKLASGALTTGVLTAHFTRKKAVYEVDYEWRARPGRALSPGARPPSAPIDTDDEAVARQNLQKIDHVVVLMLENRSFDHMLGFLSAERRRHDVDGIRPGMTNDLHDPPFTAFNACGKTEPFTVKSTHTAVPHTSTSFPHDPDHFHAGVVVQMGCDRRDMGGFVDEYHSMLRREHTDPSGVTHDVGDIMKYHPAVNVPAFDILASSFLVCNRWYSSFAGNTWVNRTIAVSGRSAGHIDNRVPLTARSAFHTLDEHGVDWRWYSQDIPTLLVVDSSHAAKPGRFHGVTRFLDDAAAGTLPPVSWIDPNFMDVGPIADAESTAVGSANFLRTANDDHPPTDVSHGQVLVNEIFWALFNGPAWEKTLFVVLYDEHGGFFDHVHPPDAPAGVVEEEPILDAIDERDRNAFKTLGCRVPAIVVSPWVAGRAATNVQFDHTSILKTILQRFCTDASGAIPSISKRVDAARHLGSVLMQPTPRLMPQPRSAWAHGRDDAAAGFSAVLTERAARKPTPRHPPTELEQQIVEARQALAQEGFRHDAPPRPLRPQRPLRPRGR